MQPHLRENPGALFSTRGSQVRTVFYQRHFFGMWPSWNLSTPSPETITIFSLQSEFFSLQSRNLLPECTMPFFFFWLRACGILVPWPGIKPAPAALEAWSLTHWTTSLFCRQLTAECGPHCKNPGRNFRMINNINQSILIYWFLTLHKTWCQALHMNRFIRCYLGKKKMHSFAQMIKRHNMVLS